MAFHSLPLCLALPVPALTLTVGILCMFSSFLFIRLLHQRRLSATLPPGPRAWPIIGNLHQLKLPAHRYLKALADKYGPILFIRLGSVPAVVVSSSAAAKQFLKTHDLIFASRPPTAAGRLLFDCKDVGFSPYGDHWRQMRKICVLELLTAKRIETFRHVREEEVSAMIQSIWEESKSGILSVNVSKAVTTVNSNIILRILAGRKFSDDDLGGEFKGFKDLMVEMTAAVGEFNIGDFIPYLDWLDLQGINQRLKKLRKTFDGFAERMINEHVNLNHFNFQKGADAEPRVQDFVDVLLRMAETDTNITRETIKALVIVHILGSCFFILFGILILELGFVCVCVQDMFVGGVASTSSTFEWAISELLRHPNAMTRLQEEIESVVGKDGRVKESDLASMKYLHCVVKETLRLYPPAPLGLPNESVEAVTVGRDPNVWGESASKFNPERFMESGKFSLADQSDFSMIPIPTIELALAQLVHTFDWRVEGDPSQLDMREAYGLTIARQVPLCGYPTLRRASFPP